MQTVTSVEVQNRFGAVANMVKGGEPVAVTQYGTPTLMILPHALGQRAMQAYNARRLVDLMDAAPQSKPDAPVLSEREFADLVRELRAS